MNLTKIWTAGLLLCVAAVWGVGLDARAESWQAPSETWRTVPENDGPATSLNWQERVLKRPVSQEQEKPIANQPVFPQANQRQMQTARRTSYERATFETPRTTRKSVNSGRHRTRLVSNEEMESIPPGAVKYEPIAEEGAFAGVERGGCSDCGGYGDCDECGTCCESDCGESCDFGYECFDGYCGPWLRNLTLFAGGQGFKGPLDWGMNGNFGFNEGLGISGPLGDPWGIGYQMGVRFTQSNFSGIEVTAPRTDRTQYFVTAGLFRRELCRGLQWGVVWDYMHDRYFDTFKLHQIRADIGFVVNDCSEFGFIGNFGASTDTYNYGNFRDIRLDPTDTYALYFRRNFENGGDGRIWGGGTGRGDGLVGADLWVPLGRSFALQNTINYKIPKEGRAGGAAHADESWGLSIQLIWYPGRMALCQRCNPYRPMQNVADNATFMVDQVF